MLRHNQRKQLGGFYDLYAIPKRRKNRNTEEGAYRVTGLNSPFGRRGSICAHLGWTWDYLHHGVPWATVQRLLIDAPSVENDEDGAEEITLTADNASEVLDMINRMNR